MNLRFLDTPSLTSLTTSGGCAAKLGADVLAEALAGLGAESAPAELIAGLNPPDDAAVYLVAPELAIIGTLDFFPPLVDDPTTFGEIAAANALSDVFAMGGRVLFALSIAAFPEELPQHVMTEILAGASSKVREAGGTLAGGHTIRDAEPKYGLAVVGTVHPDGVWIKSGARPGDAVFLTKPLGTGLVLAAKGDLAEAARWMTTLNDRAAEVLRPFSPHAVTDVTGFGLLGHAHETADRSGVRIRLEASALPALDGALEAARDGIRTGGDPRNRDFAGPHVSSEGVPDELLALAYDAQTAGGLLVTLPDEKALSLETEFERAGLFLARVGVVEEGAGVVLEP